MALCCHQNRCAVGVDFYTALPIAGRCSFPQSGRQRECGTARFFEGHCSVAVSASCRLSPDSFFPPPQGGEQILPNIQPYSPASQLPPASTVCWRPRRIRRAYVPAAGGGCGRACAQGGARTIYSCMGVRLLSIFQGCRPFEPPPIILGSISKAPLGRDSGQAAPPPRFRCCK